jgi:rfaE bifunctional protein nucleotidyltransferase chain/domain
MQNKIQTLQTLLPALAILRATGKKVVFTNGCFDLIHTGHTRYLAKAKALGDVLIVGVNSDASVRGLKGEKRPITTEDERMETLAALESVDYVVLFHEPDPGQLIAALQPDVLAKGGDWAVDKIIGRDTVEARGGKVVSLGYIEGASTTGIIEKIISKYS